MRRVKSALALAAALAVSAQEPTFKSSSYLVVAPVTVTHKDGTPEAGLQKEDFTLLDNGHPVNFDIDGYIPPISLIITVETGNLAAASLTRIRTLGPLVEPILIGARGKAAVLAYDHEVRLIQDFTSDGGALKRAFVGLKPREGKEAKMLDATEAALSMFLAAADKGQGDSRRVLIIIGESKDRGSEAKLSDTLSDVQRDNVLVYGLTYSPFLAPWTVKNEDLPKTSCCNLIDSLAELGRLGKENTVQTLARQTGGAMLGFLTSGSMEEAVAHIGDELHGQYLLSFNAGSATPPTEADKAQYHQLEVKLEGHPDLKVRTRPGYWLAP